MESIYGGIPIMTVEFDFANKRARVTEVNPELPALLPQNKGWEKIQPSTDWEPLDKSPSYQPVAADEL